MLSLPSHNLCIIHSSLSYNNILKQTSIKIYYETIHANNDHNELKHPLFLNATCYMTETNKSDKILYALKHFKDNIVRYYILEPCPSFTMYLDFVIIIIMVFTAITKIKLTDSKILLSTKAQQNKTNKKNIMQHSFNKRKCIHICA